MKKGEIFQKYDFYFKIIMSKPDPKLERIRIHNTLIFLNSFLVSILSNPYLPVWIMIKLIIISNQDKNVFL